MKLAWFLLAVALSGLGAWGGMGLTQHAIAAFDAWGNASPAPVLASLNATLTAINAPCVGFHGSVTCGPLAQLSQTEKNIGIVAGQSTLQVRQTGQLVTAAAESVQSASQDVHTVATSLSSTATAATGTLTALTGTLQTVQMGAGPLLTAYTGAGNDLDAMIQENRPSVKTVLVHGAGMSASGDLMLADAQWKTHQLLHPDKIKLGFWGATWAGIKAVHDIEPPLF